MLIPLLKKDFLLAKKYWVIMMIAAIVFPVFIQTKLILGEVFLSFFLSTLYIVFLLFSTVSMVEEKYRGAALLCTTPYTRKALVKSKYLFIISIFVGCYIFYTLTVLLSPIKIGMLDLYDIGRTFLIITAVFGIAIPVQYRFGYEKTRYIFFFFIFVTPFILPNIMKLLQNNESTVRDLISFPGPILGLLLVGAALVIGGISLNLSIQIYSKKDL
ncbi:ABC-2 transporter permease [Paenibacillus sp. J31TS4]|uniref:ABC-2 transporter permease n=1 Tax=Paenibacillus sp. J31TS4 TaxID=2807195 RepID=UPI001BCB226A|nr:ABC-2 transporter permease [Paenibacillus sp. J31TS4]